MKNNRKKLWYWLGSIAGLILVLVIVYFLFKNFYHRPVLVDMIDNVDVVGYLEWEGDKSGDIYNRLMSFDDGLAIPAISAWESKLHCSLVSCDFWGKNNALVLRKDDAGIFPEFYFYQANKTALLNAWQELTKGEETLTMFDQNYRINVRDDLIIITFRSISDAPVVLGSQSISKMPWIMSKPIPIRGNFIGFGFCQTDCINHLSTQFASKLHTTFPLISAFLGDTIRYVDFLIIPEKNRLKLNYQLYFASTYVSPVLGDTKTVSQTVYESDIYVFSGDKLQSKLDILASETQNRGLWKTVMSLGQNAMIGKSWMELLELVRDLPYELHIREPFTKSVFILHVSDFSDFKEELQSTLIDTIPILFPQKNILNLPDGTVGMELIKNNNVTVDWSSNTHNESFVVTIRDGDKSLFSINGQREGNAIRMSLTELTQEIQKYCLSSGSSEELQSIQLSNPTLPLIWWNVKSISSEEVSGELFFVRKPNSC